MRFFVLLTLVCLVSIADTYAGAPVPVESVAPLEDLEYEINEQIESLEKLLATDESFQEHQKGSIRQGFGLLACLGQALAEHPAGKDGKINGPALREGALKFSRKMLQEEATAALAAVKAAQAGTADGDFSADHDWNKLINMHPMMEEMNARNSKILRVLRRPRGGASESAHATTWAVLSLAMHADTHEVKNEADIPKWHTFSNDFRDSAVKLGEAIRAKDKVEARKWFDKANETCDACHEIFQD